MKRLLQHQRVSGTTEDDLTDDTPLLGIVITTFRGMAARYNYLGPDRPDAVFRHQRVLPSNVSSDDWVAQEVEKGWP